MKLEFDGVSVQRGRREVVHEVSFDVPSGSVLGLVGPNGSGKSSLLRTVAGLSKPYAGRVLIDGMDVGQTDRRTLAQSVAVMHQEHSEEFDLRVLELVLLGRTPHVKGLGRDSAHDVSVALEALEQVGASGLMYRNFSELSGGERQRVLCAKALCQETPILILDEPTNHLDVAHQLELLGLVTGSSRTVLIALHDLNLAAMYCDHIAVLELGKVVAHGPSGSVLNPMLVRKVFAVSATSVPHPVTKVPHLIFSSQPKT